VSNLPSLPGGLPNLPNLPGGLPSSLPNLPNMPSASSLAQGGLGSGGSLPSSIPGASLLPNPIPGNYRSQVAQGQALFQAAQNAAAGTPGSVATLLQGAATTIGGAMGNGLPKTLIMDAAGIAAGFAMGGPVGAAVGVAAAAVNLFSSLFSGPTPTVYEGFEAYPSDASVRNWSLVQNYIANLVGASESGYPPGWYLAYYQAATAAPYSLADLTDLFLLTAGAFQPKSGDTSALYYLSLFQGGSLKSFFPSPLRYLPTGYAPGGPQTLLNTIPWKGSCPLYRNGVNPSESCFALFLKNFQAKHAFDPWWAVDGMTTVPLSFLWGAPTGAGLPGSLGQGFSGVVTPGSPSLAAIQSAYPHLGSFPGVSVNNPSLTAIHTMADNPFTGGFDSLGNAPILMPPSMVPNLNSIWSQALSDISDKPHMTRQNIAKRAMSLTPRNIWFEPSLYTASAQDQNHDAWTVLYNLDVLNALATIWAMSACGAHPRAITTELLVQQANIYEHGGPNPGVQNLSVAYRRFMDEWLNISQGYPPDNHTPVLGQMSADAPPEAKATHVQNLSTLSQWVRHYLG
jgi:hypothetical protein